MFFPSLLDSGFGERKTNLNLEELKTNWMQWIARKISDKEDINCKMWCETKVDEGERTQVQEEGCGSEQIKSVRGGISTFVFKRYCLKWDVSES